MNPILLGLILSVMQQDRQTEIELLEIRVAALEEKIKIAMKEKDPNVGAYLQEFEERQDRLGKLRIEEEKEKLKRHKESRFMYMIDVGSTFLDFDADLRLQTKFGWHFEFQVNIGFISPGIIHEFTDTKIQSNTMDADVTTSSLLFELEINEPDFREKDLYFSAGLALGTMKIEAKNPGGPEKALISDEHAMIMRLSPAINLRSFDMFYVKIGPFIEFERTPFIATSTKTHISRGILFSVHLFW